MVRILLVRHGQSEWNAVGRWQGWADPGLTELGREQARLGAPAVGPVDAVVASNLRRARDTAAIMAAGLGVGHVEVEARLRERGVGLWTGLTRAEIDEQWPGALASPTDPPGGERPGDLLVRVLAGVQAVIDAHGDGVVLVVSHGGVIRCLERHLGVEPEPLPNLGGVWLEATPQAMVAGPRLLLLDPGKVAVTVPRQL